MLTLHCFLFSFSAIRRAPMPFRIRLEDIDSMTVSKAYALWHYNIMVKILEQHGCDLKLTSSGHVLLAKSIDARCSDFPAIDVLKQSPVFYLNRTNEIQLVDVVDILISEDDIFQCFLTNTVKKHAFAARIEGTSIWLLICNFLGLMSCNECSSHISRRDFDEIQRGFEELLCKI